MTQKSKPETARCHFCGKEVSAATHLCHGCGVCVCDTCDKNMGLWGGHAPEDHQTDPDEDDCA